MYVCQWGEEEEDEDDDDDYDEDYDDNYDEDDDPTYLWAATQAPTLHLEHALSPQLEEV